MPTSVVTTVFYTVAYGCCQQRPDQGLHSEGQDALPTALHMLDTSGKLDVYLLPKPESPLG